MFFYLYQLLANRVPVGCYLYDSPVVVSFHNVKSCFVIATVFCYRITCNVIKRVYLFDFGKFKINIFCECSVSNGVVYYSFNLPVQVDIMSCLISNISSLFIFATITQQSATCNKHNCNQFMRFHFSFPLVVYHLLTLKTPTKMKAITPNTNKKTCNSTGNDLTTLPTVPQAIFPNINILFAYYCFYDVMFEQNQKRRVLSMFPFIVSLLLHEKTKCHKHVDARYYYGNS